MASFQEPPEALILQVALLNAACTCLVALINNLYYFMLGFNMWAVHLFRYLFTFCWLLGFWFCGLIPNDPVSFKEILPISLTQFGASAATAIISQEGTEGSLYTLRVMDFAVTILCLILGKRYLESTGAVISNSKKPILIFIGVMSSLAWFEPSILYYSWFAFLAMPVLAICSALNIILVFGRNAKMTSDTNTMIMYSTGITAAILVLPALLITTDDFNQDMLETNSSRELIDYCIFGFSTLLIPIMVYSKYWLMCHCTNETYLVARHSKYTLGSIGHWIIHEMNYATIYSGLGKLGAVLGVLFYCSRRHREKGTVIKKYVPTTSNGDV